MGSMITKLRSEEDKMKKSNLMILIILLLTLPVIFVLKSVFKRDMIILSPNEKTQSWDVTILENHHNGIGVDCEGIIMDPPQNALFSFASKKDFKIRMKNVSDTRIEFKIQVTYD